MSLHIASIDSQFLQGYGMKMVKPEIGSFYFIPFIFKEVEKNKYEIIPLKDAPVEVINLLKSEKILP